jgi:hypothetical protein
MQPVRQGHHSIDLVCHGVYIRRPAAAFKLIANTLYIDDARMTVLPWRIAARYRSSIVEPTLDPCDLLRRQIKARVQQNLVLFILITPAHGSALALHVAVGDTPGRDVRIGHI